jgi:hypothetical protein
VLAHGSVLGCHGAAPADCEPLKEFPDILVFPPIPDSYASLTPAELAAFGIGPAHVSDDDDEEQADDDEETEDDE